MVVHFKKIIYSTIIFLIIGCNNISDFQSNEKIKLADKTPYKKVLMIGNSFTFYWNLPQVIERMFAVKDIRIQVDQKTIGGSKLYEHWNHNLKNEYQLENYDYVVFNDHSTYPMKNIDTCAKYIKLFSSLANEMNIKPLIYGTWEYDYLKDISKGKSSNTMYRLDSLATLNNATYVPVGNAFEYVEKNHPEINLYMDDNKHPSPNATYLAACVFFSTITGESPLGLPRRFEGKNIDGKKIYYIITEKKAAETTQKVADLIGLSFK